jgi:P-type Ca2+ transporter type 2C
LKGNSVIIEKVGNLVNIPVDTLQPGDLVIIRAGDFVPADLKLVEATSLEVDEFDLTGEILPSIKKINDSEVMIYRGSKIIRGIGKGIVTATGEQTEYGKIQKQSREQPKNLEFKLVNKSHFVLLFLLLPALVISLIRYPNPVIVFAIFLPLSAIIVLAQNASMFKYILIAGETRRLKDHNIFIRDITALEDFNQVDIICFDKTGVLTTRTMEVKEVYSEGRPLDIESEPTESNTFNLIKLACALCNDIRSPEDIDRSDPRDRALISFALKNGVNLKDTLFRYKRIYYEPFHSEKRYMACGFKLSDTLVYYFAKGDPEVVLRMCDSYITTSGARQKRDFQFQSSLKTNIDSINKEGNTLIALAYTSDTSEKTPLDYTFLGLLQIENPLVPGAREILGKLHNMGIRSLMLTGDRLETAGKVGEEVGITNDPNMVLTGKNIATMDLREVARQSAYVSVFARLLPSQKGMIILPLQQIGHHIAMVGDGVNDSIALKVANIGISFRENSAPIAQRLSKIIISILDDLLLITRGSRRIKRKIRVLTWFRMLTIAVIILGLYIWILV